MNFKVNIKVCRVCMKSEEGFSLYRNLELQSKFVFTTRLSLKPGDSLPSIICPKCVMRLKVAHDFVQLAHASEKNLRAFLTRISSDFQEVTKTSCSTKSSFPEDEEEDNTITTLFDEDNLQDNSNKNAPREECKEEPCSKVESRPPAKRKLSTSSTAEEDITSITKLKLQQADKQSHFKQESAEILTDEEIVYYDESNFLYESESEEKPVFAKSKASDNHVENNSSTENETKTVGEQKQINDYLEKHINVSIEQDAEGCPENLSTYYIYESATEDDDRGEAIEMEVQMDEKPEANEADLQLYEDTEEFSNDPRDGNLSSTETYEGISVKNYLQLELRTTESAESTTETEHLRPIEIISIITETETPEKIKPPKSSPLKPDSRTAETTTVGETLEVASTSASQSVTTRPRRVGKSSSNSPSINARFFCVKCNRDFSTKTNLTRHMSTHEGIKPYKCAECHKCFSQNGSLKQHMYMHTGEKPFTCDVCDRGFTQYKSLVFHMRRHTGEKPFPCDQCGLFFRQKDGLKTHILKHHMIHETDGDTETHTCVICKKLLATKYSLQVHMKKHLNHHRTLVNSQSNNITTTTKHSTTDLLSEDDLMSERAFISDELALNIEDVTSSTQILDTLSANTAYANRVKKFQCRKCYKCFAIKKNLLRHLTTHDVSASELFQCPTCQVAFDTNYALRVHRVREHRETGINLNECELCSITFANSTELNDHNKSVHDATDQNCPACPDLHFKTQKQLFEHLIEHDNLTAEDDED